MCVCLFHHSLSCEEWILTFFRSITEGGSLQFPRHKTCSCKQLGSKSRRDVSLVVSYSKTVLGVYARFDIPQLKNVRFLSFDEEPIAAASIAQVHHAVLKNHQEVAVKV